MKDPPIPIGGSFILKQIEYANSNKVLAYEEPSIHQHDDVLLYAYAPKEPHVKPLDPDLMNRRCGIP